MRLALIHRTDGSPSPERCLTWRTCRRDVHFLEEPIDPVPPGTLFDAEAYRLLLEVVCGLHSPILGETEVQAQFKCFAAAATGAGQDRFSRLSQRLLRDAKVVRHGYLQGLGAHSYGALTASLLCGSRLVVIGTGALAAEIVAAAPLNLSIDLWGRRAVRDGRVADDRVRYHHLADGPRPLVGDASTVVIASPSSVTDLAVVISHYTHVVRIIDLRAAGERTPLDPGPSLLTLDDLFTMAAPISRGGLERVAAAKEDIFRRSLDFVHWADLRPFGWDDLCA